MPSGMHVYRCTELPGHRQFFEGLYGKLEAEVFSRDPATFDQEQFSYPALVWAIQIVRSHVHQPLEGKDVALVPIADLVGHLSCAPWPEQYIFGVTSPSQCDCFLASRHETHAEARLKKGHQSQSARILWHGIVLPPPVSTAQAAAKDTLNAQVQHQRGVNAKWKVQTNVLSRGQTLTMEAATSLQAGQPLTMDFGPERPDSALLLDYGVLDHTRPAVGRCVPAQCASIHDMSQDNITMLWAGCMGTHTVVQLIRLEWSDSGLLPVC